MDQRFGVFAAPGQSWWCHLLVVAGQPEKPTASEPPRSLDAQTGGLAAGQLAWACSSIQCSISIRSSTWFRPSGRFGYSRSGLGDGAGPPAVRLRPNEDFRVPLQTNADWLPVPRRLLPKGAMFSQSSSTSSFDGLVRTSMPEWLRSIWSAGPGRDRAFCRPAW